MDKTNRTIELFRTQLGKQNISIPSAAGQWLNPVLRALAFGEMEIDFVVRPEMLNPSKILHGGIVALMFDDSIGATVFCLERETNFVTVNLNVSYLSIAKLDDTITVKTKIVRNGKTVINVEANMYKGQRLIATTASVLVSTSIGTQ